MLSCFQGPPSDVGCTLMHVFANEKLPLGGSSMGTRLQVRGIYGLGSHLLIAKGLHCDNEINTAFAKQKLIIALCTKLPGVILAHTKDDTVLSTSVSNAQK